MKNIWVEIDKVIRDNSVADVASWVNWETSAILKCADARDAKDAIDSEMIFYLTVKYNWSFQERGDVILVPRFVKWMTQIVDAVWKQNFEAKFKQVTQ